MNHEPTIKQSRDRFFFGFWREIRIIGRSKPLLASVFLYPLIIIFGLFYLFAGEVINNVPVSVVDLDKTSSSRQLIQSLSGSPSVQVATRRDTLADATDDMLSGEVFGIVLIPNDFEKNMLGNFTPEVTAFSNMQYMSMGLTLNSGLAQAFAAHLSSIQLAKMEAQGLDSQQALRQMTPIETDLHPVFNPTLNYVYTLVNGIVPTVLQVIIMLSIAYTIVQDKYSTRGILGSLRYNNGSLFRYLFGKISPYVIAFITSLCIFDIGLIVFFEIPFNGSFIFEIISSLVFIVSAGLCAVVLSLWLPEKSLNYGSVSIFASPAFGFMGLFYPRISMDMAAQIWGSILPITWYMEARLDQTLRAAGVWVSMKSIIIMIMIGIVAYMLIMLRVMIMKKEVNHA